MLAGRRFCWIRKTDGVSLGADGCVPTLACVRENDGTRSHVHSRTPLLRQHAESFLVSSLASDTRWILSLSLYRSFIYIHFLIRRWPSSRMFSVWLRLSVCRGWRSCTHTVMRRGEDEGGRIRSTCSDEKVFLYFPFYDYYYCIGWKV